ncbi:hypothetical protein BC830DRAFT_1127514 [Chytriomyces sp. MP71]|nr:hypothetical protein BC830DRAFT_1127514 [Chytriomyces sp. MP71]
MKKWFKSWGSPAASPTPSSESVDEAATVTASDAGSKQRARSKSRSRGLNGAQSRRSRSRGSNRSSFQSQSLSEDVTEEKEAAPRLKQLIRLVSTSLSSTSNTPKSITPTSLVDIDDDFPAGIPADAPLSPVHFVSELVITKHSDEDKPEEAVVVREEGAINHDAQIALADLHISHLAQLEYEPTISVVHPLRIAIAAEAPLRPSTASPTELEYRRPPVNPVNLRRASMPVHSVFTQIPSSPSETTASFVVRKISADIISPIAKVIRRHSIMGITSLLSECV